VYAPKIDRADGENSDVSEKRGRAAQHRTGGADAPRVLRVRLSLTLMGLVVMIVLTAFAARSCTASSPSSPSSPSGVATNGIAGLCANAQAVAAAGGGDSSASPDTLLSPAFEQQLQKTDPNGLKALQQAAGGSLDCPTTTTIGP
jgi:hypothetical protein